MSKHKKEKKEKDKKQKVKKDKKHKKDKHKKAKTKVKVDAKIVSSPITSDDYFNKSEEFRVWLFLEKRLQVG